MGLLTIQQALELYTGNKKLCNYCKINRSVAAYFEPGPHGVTIVGVLNLDIQDFEGFIIKFFDGVQGKL
jgi:hypothetical protein